MHEGRIKVEVEKGAIRKFAEAIGDDCPLYLDEEVAKQYGYKSVVAPPTFPATFGIQPPDDLNIELERTLHGGQEFSYRRPIVAGDVLYCESRLADTFERTSSKGNKMTFYVLEIAGYDPEGELVFTAKTTIIYQ